MGLLTAACGSSDDDAGGNPSDPQVTEDAGTCTFEPLQAGDPDGHPDPAGAKAAGQARAGRIQDPSLLVNPDNLRQKVRLGDFVLMNDRIAVFIEDKGLSDGYARFGGEILGIDKVGVDGRPMGLSRYGETLVGVSKEMVNPESVTVLADGSDGGPAIVRAVGKLETIPFVEGPLSIIFPHEYGLRAAYDYVLEPGSPKLTIRLHLENPGQEPLVLGSDEVHGFFHSNHSSLVTPELGYADPKSFVSWVGFDGGEFGFIWRAQSPMEFGIGQSGFFSFNGEGFEVAPCAVTSRDHVQVIAGGPGLDGMMEGLREVDGQPPGRTITGVVGDYEGRPVPGAFVMALGGNDRLLSRVQADAKGAYVLHVPDESVKLVPYYPGYPAHDGVQVGAQQSEAQLAFAEHGYVHVKGTDAAGGAMPVRIQVIPAAGVPDTPASYGMPWEYHSRLLQLFPTNGEQTIVVPVGEHRVIVSRGYEWEMLDTVVQVAAGRTVDVIAPLEHSAPSPGYLCADFHVHTYLSPDSTDPVNEKVASAAADGLDIAAATDHDWAGDHQPVIERVGLSEFVFGMPSVEVTTFTYGHFNALPLLPRPDEVNNGAPDWIDKAPGDLFKEVHARPEKPLIIVNHPRSMSVGGYFSAAYFNRSKLKGNHLWDDAFDLIEVFNGSDFEANRDASVADWFALLNGGRNIFAAGNSDSHHIHTHGPMGYPRTCLHFGHDEPSKLTVEAVRSALASGAAYVSGGITLLVQGPNGELPGQTVASTAGKIKLQVTAQAPSWMSLTSLEVIVDGETVSTLELDDPGAGPGKRFDREIEVQADPNRARSWVVLHAKGDTDNSPVHPGDWPFAVSNPIFFTP